MKTYKNCKLKTVKNNNGTYTTYIFNGGPKAVKEVTRKLRKDSISIAEVMIDYNEYNFLGLK